MDVSATGAPAPVVHPNPAASAVDGMKDAQARVQQAVEQVAAGRTDPAVIVDVTAAEASFAANAKILQTSQDMTRRLLDTLA